MSGNERKASELARWLAPAAGVAVLMALIAVAGAMAARTLTGGASPRPGYSVQPKVAYAIVSKDARNNSDPRESEIVAYEVGTGTIVHRIPMQYEPDATLSLDGSRLYLLQSVRIPNPPYLRYSLSLVDTRSWKILASTTVPHRMMYNVAGMTTMLLSPDQNRLFVYSYKVLGNDKADYWFEVLDAHSLRRIAPNIPMPGCGATYLADAARELLTVCRDDGTVRFVDPEAARVVSRLKLPDLPSSPGYSNDMAAGVAVSGDTAYVVSNDLRVFEVGATSHRLIAVIHKWAVAAGRVPLSNAVSLAPDGKSLVVGVLARADDFTSRMTLHVFSLPSLRPSKSVPTPKGYVRFDSYPGGRLYLLPWFDRDSWGGSTGKRLGAQAFDLSTASRESHLQFGGLVIRLVGRS